MANVSDQYNAGTPNNFAPAIPPAFTSGQAPTLPPAGLTAYQLALADKLVKGTFPPFGVNEGFQAALNEFASSKLLTPATTDPRTGQTVQPPFAPGITGNAYVIVGDMINIVRQSEPCGPGEEVTYVKVPIEHVANVATRIWTYYGDPQPSGTVAVCTGDNGGSGGG